MSQRNLDSKITSILGKNHLLSAADIITKLEARGETYNKTSVYRSLQRLLDNGEICEYGFSDSTTYELRDEHHTHLICNACDRVEIVECDYKHPTEVDGFIVDHHHLELYGFCENCRAQSS